MPTFQRSLAATAAAGALALSACGPDRCPMEAAYVDETTVPGSCAESTTTFSFTVGLCEDCRYSSPSCEADVIAPAGAENGVVSLATQWQVCEEDRGCPFDPDNPTCWTPTCVVTVPAGGTYDVYYVTGPGPGETGVFQVVFGAGSDTCG